MSPYLYSFIFNGASAAANAAMLAVILVILVRTARILFLPKDMRL
jgi:thiamine transporter